MSERVALSLDSLSVFNAAPGNLLVLLPDTPRFTIVAVTDAYLQATFTRREQLVGQSFLEVFAAPVKDGPVGVKMQASLEQVLQHRREHRLEEQRFEVMDPARGAYAYKIWRPLNRPVLDNKGTVHYIIHSVEDVTEVRQTQQQMSQREESLRASEQLIKATLDASQDMIQVFRAVRNKEGKIIDFEWILNNHTSEAYYGDVIGQRLLVNNPGVVEEDIFDAFVQVTETGVPQQNERHYVHEQFDGWFYQSVVKLGDGVVTTTSDISDRKKAELALQQSKSLLQAIINAPNIGIAVYRAVRDKQGKIVDFVHEYINRASVAMLGEDFTGKLFTDHGENATVQLPKFIEVLETGRGNSYIREAQFRGHTVWFAITNTPLDGERLVHTWEDITDRKKTEAEILRLKDEVAQKATDKYHALFYHMEQGFCIIEVLFDQADNPVDYRFLEANPVFEQQTGLKDAAGKTIRQLQPGHEEHWLQVYGNVAKTGESVHFEYEASHLSGGIWYEVYAFRVSPSANHQVALLVNDITGRKKAEEAIRESEAWKAFLLQLSDALRSIADPVQVEGTITRITMDYFGSDRCYYCQLEGDQAIIRRDAGREGLPSIAGVYPLSGIPIFKAVVDGGKPLVVHDVATSGLVDESLRKLCLQLQVISFIDIPVIKNGYPVGILCVVQSTPREWTAFEIQLAEEVAERTWTAVERAKAEEALRQSEAKFRTLFAKMEQGFCIIEKLATPEGEPSDYRYLIANAAFERHSQLKEVVGKTIRQLVPNAEARIMDRYDEVLAAGEYRYFLDYVEALDLWLEAEVYPTEQPGQVAILFSNVTERKKAEEALRKSEQQFRSLVAASSNMVYRMSADWREMYLLEGKDVLADTVHTISDWVDKYIPVEERPSVQAAIEVAIRTRQPFLHEHRVILADGSIGWVYSRAVPILDEEGRIVEWLGAGSDITLRKRAEQQIIEFNVLLEEQVKKKTRELQESKDLLEAEHYFLEQVTDKSPHLIYVFDLEEQRFTYINKRVEQLVGRDQEYVYAMGPHLFQAILHPADLPKRQEYISRLTTLSEQEIRDHEFRIWTGNTFRWFRSKDSIFKKEDGVVKQVIGLAEDVTYEKMMQERIQREGGQMGLN